MPKPVHVARPWPYRRLLTRLQGPFDGMAQTPLIYCLARRVMFRMRLDADVRVTVEYGRGFQWTQQVFLGRDVQHLVKMHGYSMRLQLEGMANGVVELVDEGR